jgi:hypothetical protein
MHGLISMLSVAALGAATVQPARAATAAADHTIVANAALGVLQQGKGGGHGGGQGGGGGQEAHGGRGQGGGSAAHSGRGQGGGQGGGQASESRGRGHSGGSDARPSRQRGSGNGNGSAARSSGHASGRSARSDDDGRGRSSHDARESHGNSGNVSSRSDNRASGSGSGSGNSAVAAGRGSSGVSADRLPTVRSRGRLSSSDLQSRLAALPTAQRRLAGSSRVSERMAVGAIARAHARGLAPNAFDVRSDNDRVRILNRRGDLLFDMDDRRAGELGGWPMRRLGDQAPRANAPAFCRNGQGHPVWGREWCIEKGFGLGSRAGTIWSRGGIGDVVFRNPDTRTRLDRGGLLGVLGDIVLGRLALQSMALGYDQPLTGYWVADPAGPRILRVRSGDYDVAELYDRDRNDRVEVLYVVQPVW